MQHSLDILVGIGILVNLVKGADLILRPHQQKWLQNKFESLVLVFDYTKPFDWYVVRGGAQQSFWPLHTTMVILIPGSGIVFVVVAIWGWRWGMVPVLCFAMLLVALLILHKRAPSHTGSGIADATADWLFDSKTTGQHLSRHLITVVAGVLALLLFYLSPAEFGENVLWWPLITILRFANIFVFLPLGILGMVSLSILLITFVLMLFELLLKLVRGVLWRIVEYNKGAFSAIVLIVTIALGVSDVYLRTKTRSNISPPILTTPTNR